MPKQNNNVSETAAALDAMLTRGLRVSEQSNRVRPARAEDIQNYLKSRGFVGADGEGSPAVFADSLGIKYGIDQSFANGVLLNWGSEIGALKDMLLKGGDITTHYRNRELGRSLLESEAPMSAYGAEAAGALVPTIGMGLPAEAQLTKRMMTPLQSAATVGAAEGAVYGLGADGGGIDRMLSMMLSTGIGVGSAAAAYGLTTLLGQLKQGVHRRLGIQSKEGEAADITMEALRADTSELTGEGYTTAEDAIAELQRRRVVAPGSQPIPADLGDEMRLTGQAVLEGGSPAQRSAGITQLQNRQKGVRAPLVRRGGQSERVAEAFERGVGLKPSALDASIDQLQDATRRSSRAAYNTAYKMSDLNDPRINQRMSLPDYRDAYRRGYEISVKEGRVDPETPVLRTPPESGVLEPPYSVAELDYTSRGLRDSIAKQMQSADGFGPQEKRAASMDLDHFLTVVDELSPEFGFARQTYALGSHAEDALTEGYNVMRKRPRAIEYDLQQLTTGEQKFYRIGAANAIFEQLEKQGLGRNVSQMIDEHPEQLRRIEILFGNEENFSKFMQRLITELEGAKTSSSLAGSQTARLQSKQRQIGIIPEGGESFVDAAGDIVTAPITAPTSSSGQLLGRAVDYATLRPLKRRGALRVADALGDTLFEETPALQALKLQTMQQLAGKRALQRGQFRGAGGLLGPTMMLPALNE